MAPGCPPTAPLASRCAVSATSEQKAFSYTFFLRSKRPDAREGEQQDRQIDAAAKAAFLAGLRDGLCREDAAAAAGFSLTGFYGARYRDPAFAADWKEALALPPAAERRARAYEERGEVPFEAAIVALDKALDALARKTGKPRPHEGEG